MSSLAQQLEKNDLDWVADFEKAVVRAAFESGLLTDFGASQMDPRVQAAVLPVLRNAGALASTVEPPLPGNPATVARLLEMFQGGNSFLKGKAQSFSEMWERGQIDLESAKSFSSSMFRNSLLPSRIHCSGRPFGRLRSLLDLGGGGGAWAVEALSVHSGLTYMIFDLSNVCVATRGILANEAPKFADRVQYASGNFFRDALPPADGYLLSNILHDWTLEKCRSLLQHLHRNVPDGATIFLNECLLDEDKAGPRFTSLFNLLMLLNHSSQQFTRSELAALLVDCGFTQPTTLSKAAHYSLLASQRV